MEDRAAFSAASGPRTESDPVPCSSAPRVQLNLNVRSLRTSATVAINERSDRLRDAGHRIFKLGLGQSPFPVPAPVRRALERNAFEKDYLPVAGLPGLKEAVAAHHRREFGIDACAEDVLIGPGSKELMFLLQLVYYGDILIPSPSWVSYAPQARIIGRHIHWIPTGRETGWHVTPAQLDALCREDPDRPRIVILNYPSNPTGGSYGTDELEGLAEVARRYRLIVLSDEIYGKLHHRDEHRSIVPLYPEGTIFSGGLSKWCGAGGWRLGLFVFPTCLSWLRQAMTAVASETFTSTSAPIQHAAVTAFEEDPEIERYLLDVRRVLRALGSELHGRLEAAGIATLRPEGGFYLFPDFESKRGLLGARGIVTGRQLSERLLADTGVAVLPGQEFGRPEPELTVRLAYVNFDGERALRGASRLNSGELPGIEFLRAYCAETLEAVDRIGDWIFP